MIMVSGQLVPVMLVQYIFNHCSFYVWQYIFTPSKKIHKNIYFYVDNWTI